MKKIYDFSKKELDEIKSEYECSTNPDICKKWGVSESWLAKFQTKHKLRKKHLQDLPIGLKVGDLKIIEKTNKKHKNNIMYRCECKCGTVLIVKATNLRKEKTTRCRLCFRLSMTGENHWNRTGFGVIGGGFWKRTESHAFERGIEFLISAKEAEEIYIRQDKKCALSGLSIEFPKIFSIPSEGTASLDRIDSDKPYIIDNVQWVHKEIQFMKWKLTDQRFKELCKKVTNFNRVKNAK